MRNNLNYQNLGDLFQTITHDEGHTEKINNINSMIRQYGQNLDQFKAQVIADKENNTFRRNGQEIKSEQVLSDFLNNKSGKIINVLK